MTLRSVTAFVMFGGTAFAASGTRLHPGPPLQGAAPEVIVLSSDARSLATASAGVVTIWDTATGRSSFSVPTFAGIKALAFAPGGTRLAAGGGKNLTIVDLVSRRSEPVQGPWNISSGLAFGRDSLAWSENTGIKVWSLSRSTVIRALSGQSSAVAALAFGADDLHLAAGEFFRITRLWSVRTGCVQQVLPNRSSNLNDLHFSPDGRWIAAVSPASVQIADAASGREIHRFLPDAGSFLTAAFAANGSLVVIGNDEGLRLWHSDPLQFVTAPSSDKPVLHIVAIGINDYPDPEWRLGFAQQDASEIARFFESNAEVLPYRPETTRLLGACATSGEIQSVFDDLARDARPNDALLVFAAGHGSIAQGEFFFRSADGRLSATDLGRALGRIQARRQMLLLDACRSGSALWAIKRAVSTPTSNGRSVQILSASSENEDAMEIDDLGHGVLTSALLSYLNARVGDRRVETAAGLLRQAAAAVPELAAKYNKSGHQKPEVAETGGDFILLNAQPPKAASSIGTPRPSSGRKDFSLERRKEFTCRPTASDPTYVRAEGTTELVGDLVMRCSGPQPVGEIGIQVFFNTSITNRRLDGNDTDALTLLEEPGTRSDPADAARRGTVFRGRYAGPNAVLWQIPSVPVDPSGYSDFQVRVTNLRLNAGALGRSVTNIPTPLMAAYMVGPRGSALKLQQQPVGYIVGVLASRLATCSGSGPQPFSFEATGENEPLALHNSRQGRMQYSLSFSEAIPDQFLPSDRWLKESLFSDRVLTRSDAPDRGTRLAMQLQNIPDGVLLYATRAAVRSLSTSMARAQLLVSDTSGDGPFQPAKSTATGLCESTSLPMAEIPIQRNAATVVWEVTAADPDALDTFVFGLMVAYPPYQVGLGTAVVSFSYAPISLFTDASPNAPIPRFHPAGMYQNFLSVTLPSARLVFPNVSNNSGQDTGLVLSNTSPGSGACTLHFAGPGPARPAQTAVVQPAAKWTSTLSTLAPGFRGCIIAECSFRPAEGSFAVFSYGQTGVPFQKAVSLMVNQEPATVDPSCILPKQPQAR